MTSFLLQSTLGFLSVLILKLIPYADECLCMVLKFTIILHVSPFLLCYYLVSDFS